MGKFIKPRSFMTKKEVMSRKKRGLMVTLLLYSVREVKIDFFLLLWSWPRKSTLNSSLEFVIKILVWFFIWSSRMKWLSNLMSLDDMIKSLLNS